ncbi:hypothetical protein TI03_00965 [Achromatium sp. WMS1]|nr:hypothetical protein TI03_00965 [Achromatium sp. WMS1]
MYLTRIIYYSQLASDVSKDFIIDESIIAEILQASRNNNSKNNITGMLLYSGNYFLQCLEGARSDVNETYNRILRDSRHNNAILLWYGEIAQRDFGIWDMGYVGGAEAREIIKTYSVGNDFNPHYMSGQSALNLLKALKVLQDSKSTKS